MTSRRFRPTRSASTPAPRFVNAFATPNATTKERIAAREASPKSSSPTRGRTLRSRPTIAPTSAFTPTRSENCAALARSPSRIEVMRVSDAAHRKSLFASMSNHMAKSVICSPAMRSTATRTIDAGVIAFPAIRSDQLEQPEHEPDAEHQHAERVEEHERVEVADHVLLPHAPPEPLEQQPRDPRDDRAQLDPRLLADVVDRARRDVAHARVLDVQVDEHVVREAVARIEAIELEPAQRARATAPCTRPASRRRASSPTRSS